MLPLEQDRRRVVERRVPPARVVPALDEVEDREPRLAGRAQRDTIEQLAFERREKAFAQRIDAPICQDCRGGASGGLEVCCAQPVILDKGVVDLSSDESLQATDNVFLRQPLGGAAGDVINGRLVPAHADDHDSVERRVGLPVTSAEQPVPVRDSARGWYRTGAAEFRKRGVGPDP